MVMVSFAGQKVFAWISGRKPSGQANGESNFMEDQPNNSEAEEKRLLKLRSE